MVRFRRLLSITLFLSERGFSFYGTSGKFGLPNNRIFLELAEFIAEYDLILGREHMAKVQEYRNIGQGLEERYLSAESQNEFIHTCLVKFLESVLEERKIAKYFD